MRPFALAVLAAAVLVATIATPVLAARKGPSWTAAANATATAGDASLAAKMDKVASLIGGSTTNVDVSTLWPTADQHKDETRRNNNKHHGRPSSNNWQHDNHRSGDDDLASGSDFSAAPGSPTGGGASDKPTDASGEQGSSPSSGPAADTGSVPDNTALNAVLAQHNAYRQRHGVPALKWSPTVAAYAQKWADGCVFDHSKGGYGENLAQGHRSFKAAVDDWYSEASGYRYGSEDTSAGHFTQMVWKSTTHLGCGVASCGGSPLYVCDYSPAGNWVGRFRENVPAPTGAS